MAELIGLILGFAGVPSFFAGWIWLAVSGFRSTPLWGGAILICPTFAAPVLALDDWKQMRWPILLHHGGLLGILAASRLLGHTWH